MPVTISARYNPNRTITGNLQRIRADLALVKGRIFSPCWGLKGIKREVHLIDSAILSHTFGLGKIATEISAIEARLDDPSFGLSEIKAEISRIASCACDHAEPGAPSNVTTTGPLYVNNKEKTLHLEVRNYTSASQTIPFLVLNLDRLTGAPARATVPVAACSVGSTELSLEDDLAIAGSGHIEIMAHLSNPSGLLVSAVTIASEDGATVQNYPAALWLPLATWCWINV